MKIILSPFFTSVLTLVLTVPVTAQTPPADASVKGWATACMACHGTNGKAQGVGLLIGGRSERELFEALQGFRSGQRGGSIMPQLAKAFSEPELKALAVEFSKFK